MVKSKNLSHFIPAFCIVFFAWLGMSGCSASRMDMINEESAISRDQAIIVLNIEWVDRFFDLKKKREIGLRSADLLLDEPLVHKRRVAEGESRLFAPLYYLSNFQFLFEADQDKALYFTRFGKDLKEYEPIAAYAVDPGTISLREILYHVEMFKRSNEGERSSDWWHKYYRSIDGDYGNWQIEAGTIYYLGDFVFHFATKRFEYGFFNRAQLNASVDMVGLQYESSFERTKRKISESMPWFPVQEMKDTSRTPQWLYRSGKWKNPEQRDKREKSQENGKKLFF